MPISPRATLSLTSSPSGGDVSTPPAHLAAGAAPPLPASAAAPSAVPDTRDSPSERSLIRFWRALVAGLTLFWLILAVWALS